MQVHSIQSLGTLDGPGVRFVVFAQGCPLRCKCCHNPDTWDFAGGKEFSVQELANRAGRYREYFGSEGGITVSGGEPLLQAAEVSELFSLCRAQGIHTCLDTSGCVLNADVRDLLSVTDRVLLDIKYTNDADYRAHVGCALAPVLDFLNLLNERNIPTTLRQVIIPTLNDTEDNIRALAQIRDAHPCVDKVELLPFRKLCHTKYEALDIPFPLENTPEPSAETMAALNAHLAQPT
ncbi:MAG: pyruvate formate lyase-activating protein [Oscillospiraceae bacterium]|nr:pyruvate formate lyase-activating protein [Oscillospiraceae bacterium]